MPMWIWGLFGVVVLAAAVLVILVRRSLLAQLEACQTQLQDARVRAEALAGDAARLADTQQRLSDSERSATLAVDQLREAAGRESDLRARLDESSAARESSAGELTAARGQILDLQQLLEAARLDAGSQRANATALTQQVDDLTVRLTGTEAARDEVRTTLGIRESQLATVVAEREAALTLVEQTRTYLQTAQATMRTVFVEAASNVFDEKAAALDRRIKETGELSKQQLDGTLKPFAEQVAGFRTRIEQLSENAARDNAKLEGAIGKLQELNRDMASATGELTRALKGNSKTRGDWGEMILETVLRACGLEEGQTFRRQASARDDESGRIRYPDVVVDLPDGRQVVIDSKVNLIAWADAHGADTSEEYQDALIRHAAALRGHMKDLADKNYPKVLGGQTLELTVLFVPIEGALAAALAMDPNLQTDAFAKRVAFASPNTLMALLKVVERLWTRDRLQKRIDVIGTEAGKLLDSLTAFLDDFSAIDDKLQAVNKVYGIARNRLHESRQSVVARAQRLVTAGARGKKLLPEELQPVTEEQSLLIESDSVETPPLEGDTP